MSVPLGAYVVFAANSRSDEDFSMRAPHETDLRRNEFGAGILGYKEVNMVDLKSMMAELQQKRDEIKLQLKLGSMEAQEEWDSHVSEWDKFLSASQFERSSEEIGEAARELGLKMKIAYDRAKNR